MGLFSFISGGWRTTTWRSDRGLARRIRRYTSKLQNNTKRIEKEDKKLSHDDQQKKAEGLKKDFDFLLKKYQKVIEEVISIIRDEEILEIHQVRELRIIATELVQRVDRDPASKPAAIKILGKINEHTTMTIHKVEGQYRDLDTLYRQNSIYLGPVQLDIASLEQEMKFLSRKLRPIERRATKYETRTESDIYKKTLPEIEKDVTKLLALDKEEDEKYIFEEIKDAFNLATKLINQLHQTEKFLENLVYREGFPHVLANELQEKLEIEYKKISDELSNIRKAAQQAATEVTHNQVGKTT